MNGCTGELVALAAPSSSSGPCAAVPQEEVQGLPAFSSQGEGLLGHLKSRACLWLLDSCQLLSLNRLRERDWAVKGVGLLHSGCGTVRNT